MNAQTPRVFIAATRQNDGKTTTSDAIRKAVAKAAETVRNLRWFEVVETRGHINGAEVGHWQVCLKIGFTLEDGE